MTTVAPLPTGADALPFGVSFAGHMVSARWTESGGWSDLAVLPFADLSVSPAAIVLHYGQAVFEGLKAYRQPDGGVALFRPDVHAARFRASARRLAMPELPDPVFVEACEAVVRADPAAVPDRPGHSLYLRPLLFATELSLGVRAARAYQLVVMASPAPPFFGTAVRAITIQVAHDHVRAAPGGLGAAKCAANYSASLATKQAAVAAGCDEVLWLDATERRWIEELSGMNVFVVSRDASASPTLVTPPTGDTILAGVTRASILELAPRLGLRVEDRPLSLAEWEQGCAGGTITEAFACGTAAVVAPIGEVRARHDCWLVGDGAPGPVAAQLRAELVDLHEGRAPDPLGWRKRVA